MCEKVRTKNVDVLECLVIHLQRQRIIPLPSGDDSKMNETVCINNNYTRYVLDNFVRIL